MLADLERLDDELTRIKGHLENASASADSYDRLSKLEKAISETKVARRRALGAHARVRRLALHGFPWKQEVLPLAKEQSRPTQSERWQPLKESRQGWSAFLSALLQRTFG